MTEASTLPAGFLALIKQPMEVKPCDLVSKCMANASSYRSHFERFSSTPTMMQIANHADRQLADAWTKTQEIHAANEAAIASNRSMRELLMAVMTAAGMPSKYSHFGLPTPRSRFKKQMIQPAGYPNDINRTFPVDDGFSMAQSTYQRLTAEYARYRLAAEDESKQIEKVKDAEKAKRKADIELAKLIVRYELSEDAEWDDALDAIRKRDQYLDLAIAGQQTRGDWSEGFYRVQHAFDRFKINDDRDKQIAADICGCLASDDDCRDGRVFRDTKWSYTALFEIVADKQLVQDAQLCLEHIER